MAFVGIFLMVSDHFNKAVCINGSCVVQVLENGTAAISAFDTSTTFKRNQRRKMYVETMNRLPWWSRRSTRE